MRAVVADTGPLNYLALIGHASLFPAFFETVFVPESVRAELDNPKTPLPVQQWISSMPPWLVVQQLDLAGWDTSLSSLDKGERDAIMLAISLKARLILMDDRAGVVAARAKGFTVFGTIGLLDLAAKRNLVDLKDCVERLRATNFHCRPQLLDALLAQHKEGKRS